MTPEATRAVLEREAPGLAELMRREGIDADARWPPCRVRSPGRGGGTLIVNLPGSPKGVARESRSAARPSCPHAVELLGGATGAHRPVTPIAARHRGPVDDRRAEAVGRGEGDRRCTAPRRAASGTRCGSCRAERCTGRSGARSSTRRRSATPPRSSRRVSRDARVPPRAGGRRGLPRTASSGSGSGRRLGDRRGSRARAARAGLGFAPVLVETRAPNASRPPTRARCPSSTSSPIWRSMRTSRVVFTDHDAPGDRRGARPRAPLAGTVHRGHGEPATRRTLRRRAPGDGVRRRRPRADPLAARSRSRRPPAGGDRAVDRGGVWWPTRTSATPGGWTDERPRAAKAPTQPRYVRRNRASWNRDGGRVPARPRLPAEPFRPPRLGGLGDPGVRARRARATWPGMDVLEFGCGGGQWSISLARLGARPVGLDLSINQLSARAPADARAHRRFPLVNANAERTPFADESFDLVFCDHGAMSFADPAPHGPRGRAGAAAGRSVRVQHREPAHLAVLGRR